MRQAQRADFADLLCTFSHSAAKRGGGTRAPGSFALIAPRESPSAAAASSDRKAVHMIDRRALLAALLATPALSAASRAAAEPPLEAAARVAPRRVPTELAERALAFPAAPDIGGGARDVVFVEFFDYNCPWCRASAREIAALVEDEGVGYRLVNYPILGAASHEASRIALGFLALHGAGAYRDLHAAIFSARGRIDGARVLAIAEDLGYDAAAIGEAAALPGIAPALEDMLGVGRRLGLDATPSTLVGPFAFDGYLPPAQKRAIVQDLRA